MIEANKNAAFERLFRVYNKCNLRKHFFSVRVAGLRHIHALDRTQPIIFYGNHSNWWDGLVEHFLATEVFDLDLRLMMEEKQMERYKFFRWCGAFSVNRDSPKEAVQSMRYASSLFNTPGRALWIYPQGRLLPNDVRPLEFFTGIARIIQLIGRPVQLVPFARRYDFLMQQRPEVFTLIGDVQLVDNVVDPRQSTMNWEKIVTGLLDLLRCKILTNDLREFETVLVGRSSTNENFDAARMRS